MGSVFVSPQNSYDDCSKTLDCFKIVIIFLFIKQSRFLSLPSPEKGKNKTWCDVSNPNSSWRKWNNFQKDIRKDNRQCDCEGEQWAAKNLSNGMDRSDTYVGKSWDHSAFSYRKRLEMLISNKSIFKKRVQEDLVTCER